MTDITITAADGGTFSAYMSAAKTGKGPGLVIIQEIFGVNAFLRDLCDRYAALGYTTICPDLFWRMEPGLQLNPENDADSKKAFQLYEKFNEDKGVKDLIATLNTLRQHEACTGKVGTVGFCLGGKLAYLMATRSDIDASVSYYGVGIEGALDEASTLHKPLLLHIGEKDKFVPKASQSEIRKALQPLPFVTMYFYPGADHAFARTGGKNYDAASAVLAQRRTREFFHHTLGH